MESGEWRVERGEWRGEGIEGGGWRVESADDRELECKNVVRKRESSPSG